MFTEVLNHVISLGFTVDKKVKANSLLEADDFFNLFLDEFFILFVSEFTLAEFQTSGTDLFGLLMKC